MFILYMMYLVRSGRKLQTHTQLTVTQITSDTDNYLVALKMSFQIWTLRPCAHIYVMFLSPQYFIFYPFASKSLFVASLRFKVYLLLNIQHLGSESQDSWINIGYSAIIQSTIPVFSSCCKITYSDIPLNIEIDIRARQSTYCS